MSAEEEVKRMRGVVEKQAEEIRELKDALACRDNRIAQLTGLVDKYQSVFCRQTNKMSLESNSLGGEREQTIVANSLKSSLLPKRRGIGISAEPANKQQASAVEIKSHPKPEHIRQVIEQAIAENEFLNNLAQDQLQILADTMHPTDHNSGDLVIREGELGNLLYVLVEGTLEIIKNNMKLREIGKGTVFGELAVLYNCKRTATVKAASPCKLFAIDRMTFQSILRKCNMQRQVDHVAFIKSIPIFNDVTEDTLSKIADELFEMTYAPSEYIIRQGARGDNFFIIAEGTVRVTISEQGKDGKVDQTKKENFVRTLGRGDWFGEKALKGDTKRTANIIASEAGPVKCLVLDYESYHGLIDKLVPVDKSYPDVPKEEQSTSTEVDKYQSLQLGDLVIVGTLGCGGFGRVELVHLKDDKNTTFALKTMKKKHIVQMRQEQHVLNEREIMGSARNSFVVRLHRTFKNNKFVYLLLEPCLGGELWALLRDQYFFTESAVQFYIGCVVEAIDYLHGKRILYRDLKPENLMLDTKGYCKLTDFGFAKYVGQTQKTWTFCGTPEYMAPEIILNKGHDMSADLWSIGILIYELLTGLPPFDSPDAMRTYSLILKGIEAIGFPGKISRNAQDVIKKLCRDKPSERLGYGKGGIREIEKHAWYEGFDWVGLQNKTLKAPYQRHIGSSCDMQYFDNFEAELEEPPDELSGWDATF